MIPGVITQCAAVGITVEPKILVLNLVQEHFLLHFPDLERIQGVLDGVPRGPVGPPGPLELAALLGAAEPGGPSLGEERLPAALPLASVHQVGAVEHRRPWPAAEPRGAA